MAPSKRGRRAPTTRQPLASTPVTSEQTQVLPSLIEIFNNSQHVTSSDLALNQLKKLYKNTQFQLFQPAFTNCFKKLLQSKPQTLYFKTCCEVVTKFLQHVSKLSDEIKSTQNPETSLENADPSFRDRRSTRSSLSSICSAAGTKKPNQPKTGAKTSTKRRGRKRKASTSDEEDELIQGLKTRGTEVSIQTDTGTEDESVILETTSKKRKSPPASQITGIISEHDQLISSCIDTVHHYIQLVNEDCRLNSVFFISKFLSQVDSLDEEIIDALSSKLPERIRDRKPLIRAHAVYAAQTFQEQDLIKSAFLHHFSVDPEIIVRKALLQNMHTRTFGYDFLCDSTQDSHDHLKKTAFRRLGKINPSDLSQTQLHKVIHNGLNERDRSTSTAFKTYTLDPWLSSLYDGLDLYKLLDSFDVLNNHEDICRLLEYIYAENIKTIENNGASTKLHRVVENFKEHWLNTDNTLNLRQIDEKVTTIWLSLVKFCKTNIVYIKHVRVRSIEPQTNLTNDSIEKILDSQQRHDEVAEVYERLTPDLVNLVDFLARFVNHASTEITINESETGKMEFIYQQLMLFLSSYEIGDEMERKTVQEVLSSILKENLLTGKFDEFIMPIIKCLNSLIYHSSPRLMVDYIAELIHNVRSHLEDLISSTQPQHFDPLSHSTIVAPIDNRMPRSVKKVRISNQVCSKRNTQAFEHGEANIDIRRANIRVEIEEYKDEYDAAMKIRDFDQAKIKYNKISDLKAELALLNSRRMSLADEPSDIILVEGTNQLGGSKLALSSTMLAEDSMTESVCSEKDEETDRTKLVFKHHRNELLKCLQMYFGCLQSVKVTTVHTTMLNHLKHLVHESLQNFEHNVPVFSLALACSGLTALVDKEFAKNDVSYKLLLVNTCLDRTRPIEMKSVAFKCVVDIACQHDEVDVGVEKLEKFLIFTLRDYRKWSTTKDQQPKNWTKNELEFISAIIEGTAKLYFFKKLSCPKILAHLIVWWYLPGTHSRLKQFIGIFLPELVVVRSVKRNTQAKDGETNDGDETWLEDLLGDTFMVSIEYLHTYISSFALKDQVMDRGDMLSLISFLCNLIPVSYHSSIRAKVDEQIDESSEDKEDLLKFLKLARNSLTIPSTDAHNPHETLTRPVENVD